ncbi:DUF6430 domain-containing protein [Methanimicrococcus sp. OttesenSCG-928-J09]|nr:DUF6430 domain-containing protein [Methanimicrococcus sp. OttesenSCG-928-J09]
MNFLISLKYALKEKETFWFSFSFFLSLIFFFEEFFSSFKDKIGIILVALFVSFFISWIRTLFRFQKEINLDQGRKAVILFGDLFKIESKITVIPVNLFFDTEVDDKLISSHSIHGQFVNNIFKKDISELDNLISDSLNKQKLNPEKKDRTHGKSFSYPPGTIAEITKDNHIYYLLALTDFDSNNIASCKLSDYYSVILSLIEYFNINGQGRDIAIPLLGSGLSRLGKENNIVLRNMISVFRMCAIPIRGKIRIVLFTSLRNEINLNEID